MNCKTGEHILEVGVGTGLSLPLYPKDVLVTGIDVSSEMLARAEARRLHDGLDNVVELKLMDAEKMEFEGSRFDKVVAMYVVSVVPNPDRLVEEMRRVCKPDGQIVFVNHFHSVNPVLGRFETMIAPLSTQLGFRPNLSLDQFLDDTGLMTTGVNRVNLFNFSTMVEARNTKRAIPVNMSSVCVSSS